MINYGAAAAATRRLPAASLNQGTSDGRGAGAAAFEWALAIFLALTLADALGDRTPSAAYIGVTSRKPLSKRPKRALRNAPAR
jgi:hypothetical protein